MNFYDLKPNISDVEFGPEPSIYELLYNYYFNGTYDETFARECADKYIDKLEQMRHIGLDVFISGPNGFAFAKIGDSKTAKINYEKVIDGLCALTGDEESDYTATKLKD